MQNPMIVVPLPGEQMTFEPLTLDFLVDERMENYRAIYDWITGLGFPENHSQYTTWNSTDPLSGSELKKNASDATLSILDGSNNVIQNIQFYDCWPETLGSLTFLSSSQDVQYLVGSVTFRYTSYKFI